MGGGASKGAAEGSLPGGTGGELDGVVPVPKKQEAMGTPAAALQPAGAGPAAATIVRMKTPNSLKVGASTGHLTNQAMLNLLQHPEHCNTLVRLIRERIR